MDYQIGKQQMISGRGEAESRKYIPLVTEEGYLWLVADQPNMGDNVYFCSFDPRSQGFGGATLHFELVDGSSIDLPAPWHGNTDSLYHDTGIDIRDTHLTFVVVARDREHQGWQCTYKDVLYMDKEPMVGDFDRGEAIAKEWANKLGVPVMCYRQSAGGSSDGPVNPDKCGRCGELLGNEERAEIVDKDGKHKIIHQTCYLGTDSVA